MNCDDCKAQVLELIERESIDPEGVRAVLAECPDCRAKFDETKALLALAGELPVEAPPARLDAAILRAAEGRNQAAVSLQRAPWGAPLAMAAVALLVVGIGVATTSIIGGPREEVASAPSLEDQAIEHEAPADLAKAAGRGSMDEASAGAGAELAAMPAAEEPASPQPARAARGPSVRKKEARRAARRQRTEPEQVDLEMAEYDAADAAAARADAAKSAVTAGAANEKAGVAQGDADADAARECARKVRALEKQRLEDAEYEPAPEAQLEAGLCYRLLGRTTEARAWLQRAAEHPSTKARANEALGALE